MGKGETDWMLLDAYEIQMRTIPGPLRFTSKLRAIAGVILFLMITGFATLFFMMVRTDFSAQVHAIVVICWGIWTVFTLFVAAWFVIGVLMERNAYSKACRMAAMRDQWEREKFRKEYEETVKYGNYKN